MKNLIFIILLVTFSFANENNNTTNNDFDNDFDSEFSTNKEEISSAITDAGYTITSFTEQKDSIQ